MAQNIALMGAEYSDVSAVELPKAGGGVARFADPSETTATAEDVTYPKTFLNSSGELITGMNGYTPGTWTELAEQIRRGNLPSVGTQIEDDWTGPDGTVYTAVWDVVDYSGGYMWLQWHYCFPGYVIFDADEALYYVGSSGLAAGTYYIDNNYNNNQWSASQNIQFTLAQACDPGDQLCFDQAAANINPTNNRTIYVYGYGGTTVKQTATTSNGTSGTKLGSTKTSNLVTNGNVNSINRMVWGYNHWSQSALRQYLNSASPVGDWWLPQNPWDRPPAYITWPGFLSGFSADFLNIIEATTVTTKINTAEGSAETHETTSDRCFLPSIEQINTTPDVSDHSEGSPWQYYVDLATDAGYSGYMPLTAIAARKKYRLNAKTTAENVRLRSQIMTSNGSARCILTSGEVSGLGAKNATVSVCPAFAIKL